MKIIDILVALCERVNLPPLFEKIESKLRELLETPKAHKPIWRRKSETSYEIIYGEILRIINNG